jgi:hypothetical protein
MDSEDESLSCTGKGRRSWLRVLFRLLRWMLLVLVVIPVLVVASCIGGEMLVSGELEDLCGDLDPGRPLDVVTTSGFETRSTHVPEDGEDWFDREYRRIQAQESGGMVESDALIVLFAKPGLGYYACIVRHREGRVTSARYVDRSS